MHDHEHEHHHEEEHLEAFTLFDEAGNEHHFVLLAELEKETQNYWVCEEIFVENEEIKDFGDLYLFKKATDEEGNVYLDSIEDENEFNEVIKIWEDMTSEEIVEDDSENVDN
ncbi:DUF1292 domain-containing protein [Thermosipho ferrireducens]|uniref:DUF1292 domain-containing protein n=1 Tax=Thermosipho ferrireducens TaxID=2571116 RepID=A0ABX7SAX6_9BACT|nr:DUF1292 domain-containing protein [Thermosipho ferrireducens]QTA38611.1 DUF1292 domain-containing protein [Thermosipho ferrireducens]